MKLFKFKVTIDFIEKSPIDHHSYNNFIVTISAVIKNASAKHKKIIIS